ncbi:unnamed protein product [Diamesa serratosioi]
MSKKKNELATALDEESDSSFRTLPTDDEQTNYSLEEDRTFRRHRSFIDKENNPQSKKTSTSNPKMVKPQLTKAKPLQPANKSNTKSPRHGHVRITHEDSDSSSNPSQNVVNVESRRSRSNSSALNEPPVRANIIAEKSNQTRHKRKKRLPVKSNGVLNEIKKLQMSTQCLIPLSSFGRLVREIMRERSPEELRITPLALHALRESCEAYLVKLFEDVNRIALNRNQVTIQIKDMHLALFIRNHD